MGRFVNPDNRAFQVAINSEIYVDKTGLLAYTNKVIDTKQGLICNSRPRRFGKSVTADMLTAYYSRGCDSEQINPNAVVCLMLEDTFQSYWSDTGTYESILPLINMNFDGLKTAALTMLSGDSVKVRTNSYQNDMVTFRNKDDVLTLLIHLG